MTRTSTAVSPEVPPPAPEVPPPGRRITIGRIGAAVVIIGILAMWGYVLGVRWFGTRAIDRWDVVDDPAWVAAAAAACAPSAAQLDGVEEPDGTPEQQGAAIQAVTDVLAQRVAALEAIEPTASHDADDAEAVRLWLADWHTHLAERTAYANVLLDGADVVFNGTATDDGESITERMDAFTERNEIPGCATVDDLRLG